MKSLSEQLAEKKLQRKAAKKALKKASEDQKRYGLSNEERQKRAKVHAKRILKKLRTG